MAKEEFEPIDYETIRVACQLCGRWFRMWDYEDHYDRCLDIEYLVKVAKENGQDITREDLEEYPQETINKLLRKYEPKKVVIDGNGI